MKTIEVGALDEIENPGCREFSIGDGDWPFKGFVVRQGDAVFAYQNFCAHVGHPLNWKPDNFLTKDGSAIICASHGRNVWTSVAACALQDRAKGKALRNVAVEVRDGTIYVTGPDSM